MQTFTLTWITAIVFVVLAFWGVNVPTRRRSHGVIWIVTLLVLFNLLAQSYLFRGAEAAISPGAAQNASELIKVQNFLNAMALQPGTLRQGPLTDWYKIISSSMLHLGWVHLLVNVWFFILFGHVLEQTFGIRKFLAIVAAGLLIPPGMDGLLGNSPSPSGGFGGVVYAVMGAFIVCFPRSRCYGAVNYDLKFWAAVLFIILPITMVTRYAGMTLTEPVMLMGILGFFLLVQPEHARISAAAAVVILYKFLLDILLIQPAVDSVAGNTPWRVFGGFAVGAAAGLIIHGKRGWRQTWEDETAMLPKSSRASSRMSLAQLEAAAHKSPEAARAFLGQRVFVGDSARATTFYREIALKKFPDLMLPLQEQMALARLLQFKGYEKEALHAYETLIRNTPSLPYEYWSALLKAAQLTAKHEPSRAADATRYLDRFEQGTDIMNRDRIEAEQLRAALSTLSKPHDDSVTLSVVQPKPAAAAPEDEIVFTDVNYGPAGAPGSSPPGSPRKQRDQAPPVLQFPKAAPRTFSYDPDAPAIPIAVLPRRSVEDPSPEEILRQHWKPLPCISEKKQTASAIFDRRIRNPRIAEDEAAPSMYSGVMNIERHEPGRKRGRLSRLEVARRDSDKIVPTAEDKPSRYGGLDEHQQAGSPPHTGFRLRGEKNPADAPRQKINRQPQPELPGDKS